MLPAPADFYHGLADNKTPDATWFLVFRWKLQSGVLGARASRPLDFRGCEKASFFGGSFNNREVLRARRPRSQ
jgi:hypothetical protein